MVTEIAVEMLEVGSVDEGNLGVGGSGNMGFGSVGNIGGVGAISAASGAGVSVEERVSPVASVCGKTMTRVWSNWYVHRSNFQIVVTEDAVL